MTKVFLTLITLFVSMSYSLTAFAHAGHSYTSVTHSALHITATITVFLALMAVGFLIFKHLPTVIAQRNKK